MSQKRIQQIERRIDRVKTALLEIGPMRPGSLTRQYKDPQHHAGAYWQISYTRRMKSRTEYVRREWVKDLPEAAVTVEATVPVRIPSELGRKEFVLVALVVGGPGGGVPSAS